MNNTNPLHGGTINLINNIDAIPNNKYPIHFQINNNINQVNNPYGGITSIINNNAITPNNLSQRPFEINNN